MLEKASDERDGGVRKRQTRMAEWQGRKSNKRKINTRPICFVLLLLFPMLATK